MEKDFAQFGGWLKFFYVLFWISFVLCCLAVPAEVYFRVSDNPELVKLANGVEFFESIIMGIIYWFIIQNMKICTPQARNLVHHLAAFLVVAIFLFAAFKALFSGNPFWEAYDYPSHIFVPLTFALYLSQSKRVTVYYQLPEEEQVAIKITREASTAVAHGMVKMFSIVMLVACGVMAFAGALIYLGQ